jgi:TonB family protein
MKSILTFVGIFYACICFAQKHDVYYLKNDGRYVNQKDSADYLLVISEPDAGSTLYNVFQLYLDGSKKLVGKSAVINPPRLEGQSIAYYKNGRKSSIGTYQNGFARGLFYEFYPNGKPYLIREYPQTNNVSGAYADTYLIKANYDSLGKAQVEDGNGYFKGYDSRFTHINEEGSVKEGRKEGVWRGSEAERKITYTEHYEDGNLVTGTAVFEDGTTANYIKTRGTMPEFKGGVKSFGEFLSNNIRYPNSARRSGTQGVVVLSFVVEKDGRVTDIKVKRSVSPDLDEAAIEVLKKSPLWIPGTQFGRAVRVAYAVPVSFKLNN